MSLQDKNLKAVGMPYNLNEEKQNNKPVSGTPFQGNFDYLAAQMANKLDVQNPQDLQGDLNVGGYRVVNLAPGINPDDGATVSQITGGVFAKDVSTDPAVIDLKEVNPAIQKYFNGLIITFIATKNSVNNMTLRLNGLEYKQLDSLVIGVGSFTKEDIITVMYDGLYGYFTCLNSKNTNINNFSTIKDFNDFIYPCDIWVRTDTDIKHSPIDKQTYGRLTVTQVVTADNARKVLQTFVQDETSYVYKRNNVSGWTSWSKLSTSTDLEKLIVYIG